MNAYCQNVPDRLKITEKLQECVDALPFSEWTQACVFDACDQYMKDNQKTYLTTNDFKMKKLPSHSTIKNRFGITAKEFRDKYYPIPKEYKGALKSEETNESKINRFIERYNIMKPSGAGEYTKLKSSYDVGWVVCAKIVGAKNWTELINTLRLKRYTALQVRRSSYNSITNIAPLLSNKDKEV